MKKLLLFVTYAIITLTIFALVNVIFINPREKPFSASLYQPTQCLKVVKHYYTKCSLTGIYVDKRCRIETISSSGYCYLHAPLKWRDPTMRFFYPLLPIYTDL